MRAKQKNKRAFSLMEFAIVLGVIGSVTSVIWYYASNAYENVKRQQAFEAITATVANVRSYYQGQMAIPTTVTLGGVSVGTTVKNFVPYLFQNGINVIPQNLLRTPLVATCQNANNQCADTPWGQKVSSGPLILVDPYGTFDVCAWQLGVNPVGGFAANYQSGCGFAVAPTAPTQFFAIQVNGLPFGACMALSLKVSSSSGPRGLYDVLYNSAAAWSDLITSGKPISPISATDAKNNCKTGIVNSIIFVYRLAVPQ